MTLRWHCSYNGAVTRVWRRGAITALFASACFLGLVSAAAADELVDAGPAPVVKVWLDTGKLTVETWDNPTVLVTSRGQVTVDHMSAQQAGPAPRSISVVSQSIPGPNGSVTLPAESFVLPKLGDGHQAVVASGSGDTTVEIPRGTALVVAHVRRGRVTLSNYDGAFVAHVRTGAVVLDRVSGTGFAEVMRGPVVADHSTFTRLRVRTALGNMLFRGCTSHQIEATSAYGSIVYDNGRFQPGLAHFESEHGNVALGVRGSAQIGAHSGSGHIVSKFANDAQINGNGRDAQASVRGGGPMVTTNARNGSVFLYNGSMRAHPELQRDLLQGRPASPAFRALEGGQTARPQARPHAPP